MKKRYFVSTVFLLAVICPAPGQTVKVPITLDAWDKVAVKLVVETYKGKECFLLSSGAIVLMNAEVHDGTIEATCSFSQQRECPGFSVRMRDLRNAESLHVRSHQSGNTDATQYTPVFNALSGW